VRPLSLPEVSNSTEAFGETSYKVARAGAVFLILARDPVAVHGISAGLAEAGQRAPLKKAQTFIEQNASPQPNLSSLRIMNFVAAPGGSRSHA
jgi:hypothetical protein